MALMTDFAERCRALVFRRRVDRELDEEMAFHLEHDIAQRIARGADPADARRAAIISIGGMPQVKEAVREARGVQPLEDLVTDVRHAIRTLRAAPMFVLTVIAVIGIALGAATVVFAVADAVLFSDHRNGVSDRLVRIYESNGATNRWGLSSVDALALLEQQNSFDAIGIVRRSDVALAGAGQAERVGAGWATSGFFAAVGARAETGRLIAAGDESESSPWVAVVSHAFAAERFGGNSTALGRDIVVDGIHHTIVGVLPAGVVELAGVRTRIWLPLRIKTPARRGPFWLRGVGLLRSDVTIEQAREDLAGISARIFPLWASSFRDKTAVLLPVPLRESILLDAPKRITLFAAAVALVWAIAVANVATLMLVRASSRDREIAVRLALGASRSRIVRWLLTDSLVLTVTAGAAGLLLVAPGIRWVQLLAPGLPRIADAALDARALTFGLSAAAITGMLVSVPALLTSLRRRRQSLNVDSLRSGRDRHTSRTRAALVTLEFALALPLLAGACWFVQSLLRLQEINPGIDANGAVVLDIQLAAPRYTRGEDRAAFWQRLEDRAREIPGIVAVGFGVNLPPDDPNDVNNFDLVDHPARGGAEPTAPWNSIRPGFLDALGVRLLEGRTFTAAEYKSGTSGALVSAAWARKYFPGASAIGRKMVSGGCTTCPLTEVIGIVSDVKYRGLDGDADAVYDTDNPANALSYRMVARTSGPDDAAIRALSETIRQLDSEALVASSTMQSRVGRALNEPRYWTTLVGGFAAVAVALAALGVFGLMSFMVRQQRREIGVRLALGATPFAITQTVVKRGMGYAAAGSIAGALLAVLAGRWLQASAFGIQTTDSIVVVAVGLSLALLAALASWWPGRQAARVRPIEAMTVE